MKITKIITGPDRFELVTEDGRSIEIRTHREILWAQNLVVLPPGAGGVDQVALQNPEDEDSPTTVVHDAAFSPEVADWQRRWARSEVKDGEHQVSLELYTD
jgi:hypothetical protein